MNSLVVTHVKSSKRDIYYNRAINLLKGLAGGYMHIVGGTLRFLAPGLVPATCGLLAAFIVQSFI